jgi:hypothetical protein
MANAQQLKQEAARLLTCPIDWSSIAAEDRDQCRWLYLDWFRCIYEVAVSVDEHAVVSDMADHEEFDHRVTASVVTNLRDRDNEAQMRFKKAASLRLSRLTFVAPSEQQRHFKRNLGRAEIMSRSIGGPSLFFSDYTSDQVRKAFWSWLLSELGTDMLLHEFIQKVSKGEMDEWDTIIGLPERRELWNKFRDESHFRMAVNNMADIGAVNGKTTQVICFDIAIESAVVHFYPINKAEAEIINHPLPVWAVEMF